MLLGPAPVTIAVFSDCAKAVNNNNNIIIHHEKIRNGNERASRQANQNGMHD